MVLHITNCCVHLYKKNNGHHFQQLFPCQFLSWLKYLFEHVIFNQIKQTNEQQSKTSEDHAVICVTLFLKL
jgi:hypothetical protein